MKLSTKGKYGLRALIDLAQYSEDSPVSITSIAAVYTIPHPPLSLPHHLYIYVILLRKAPGYPHGISSEEPLIGS